MKNAYKLAFTVAALFITCSISAQNNPNMTTGNTNPTVKPNTGTKGGSTTNSTTTGTSTGINTNDGSKTGTRNTTPNTGTSEKMAIGDQGTVEDKKTNKNGTGNPQITPKK